MVSLIEDDDYYAALQPTEPGDRPFVHVTLQNHWTKDEALSDPQRGIDDAPLDESQK